VKDKNLFQVMFSDGIRPGGDLTDLDGSSSSSRSAYSGRRRKHRKSHKSTAEVGKSLIPVEDGVLPLLLGEREPRSAEEIAALVISAENEPVPFQINKNLIVHVKIVKCKRNRIKNKFDVDLIMPTQILLADVPNFQGALELSK
jgi:hypothetical protein